MASFRGCTHNVRAAEVGKVRAGGENVLCRHLEESEGINGTYQAGKGLCR